MKELRRALGSITRALSRADLAEFLNARDSSRRRNTTTVQRWEEEGVEPDYSSAKIMAELAGVTFEEFALGTGAPELSPREPVLEPEPISVAHPSARHRERKKGA